jgi:hypothetical protein
LLNVRLAGKAAATGVGMPPVPVTTAIWGLSGELSVKVSEALRSPFAVGVNVTLTVQEPLAESVAPLQVSALVAKSLAFVPPKLTVEMVTLAAPVLVTDSV